MAKRRKVEAQAGDLVAIPLLDGSLGHGHVLEVEGGHHGVVVVVGRARARTREALLDLPIEPIACHEISGADIEDGDWPIIGRRELKYGANVAPEAGVSHSDNLCSILIEAWNGLRVYNNFEGLLLPGLEAPATPGEVARARPVPARPAAPAPTSGPAEVTILIAYEGDGMPTAGDLALRRALEARVEADVGEVTDTGAGQGTMEVVVEVEDVAVARPALEAVLEASGLADRAIVDVVGLA